jgi:hypothetical protein
MNGQTTLNVFVTILWLVLPAWSVTQENEKPPVLAASDLYPDLDLKTELYSVESKVTTDGFLTKTVIDSEFGKFTAVGPGMLFVRLNELEALEQLEKLEDSDEFQRGVKDSANEKAQGMKQIIDNPNEAAKGFGQGVNRFFKRAARATKTGYQTASDVYREEVPGAGQESGPGKNLPGGTEVEAVINPESKYTKMAKASGKATLNILGFEDSRRGLAKRLGVDPYTTNPILDTKLREVTSSLFAGDFAVDVVTSLIPGGFVVSSSTMVGNWVWDTPPGDLRVQIEQSLVQMGMSTQEVDRFLRHFWYPLSYQAVITKALEALDGVLNIPEIMPLVLTVTTFDQARFVMDTLNMLAHYHKDVQRLKTLRILGTIVAIDQNNSLVVMAPADFMSWSEPLNNYLDSTDFFENRKIMHIAGSITDNARRALKSRDWQVTEHSELLKRIGTIAEH